MPYSVLIKEQQGGKANVPYNPTMSVSLLSLYYWIVTLAGQQRAHIIEHNRSQKITVTVTITITVIKTITIRVENAIK